MNELNDYIAVMEPVRGVEKVRHEIQMKAQKEADKYCPDDKELNQKLAMMYMIGMFDTIDLIYY